MDIFVQDTFAIRTPLQSGYFIDALLYSNGIFNVSCSAVVTISLRESEFEIDEATSTFLCVDVVAPSAVRDTPIWVFISHADGTATGEMSQAMMQSFHRIGPMLVGG